MKLHHLAALFLLLLAGCAAGGGNLSSSDSAASSAELVSDDATAGDAPETNAGAQKGKGNSVGANAQAVSKTKRVIIYTATVDLVVENLTNGQNKLTQLVKANGGYIAQTDVGGASGSQRTGSWKVRVPVEKYEAFMAGAQRLGELQSINSSSQDVTAEFYDVSARIKINRSKKRVCRNCCAAPPAS